MKNIISILIISLLLFSCEKKEELSTNTTILKKEKASLKKQVDSINKLLKNIETKLAKLDTVKKLPIVTAIASKEGVFKHYIEIQGTVKSDKSVEIHPEMGGTISHIYVKEGQRVRRGQTLAQLDASVVNNNIAQVKTQLTLAKTAFERQARLWKQKIGSEMQYLQAKAQKEGLEQNINTLYAQARKMKIIAPFNGTIDEIFAKTGALAMPQQPFLRIVNLHKVYVESEITETYLKNIKKGSEVLISFPSLDKKITSKISQVGNFINPNNRSFKARININNYNKVIKPNLLADVKVKDFEGTGIIIPSYLVQKDQSGNHFVYVVRTKDSISKVQKTLITVEKEYNNESFITKGIQKNDLILDKGAHTVKDNDQVILAKQ